MDENTSRHNIYGWCKRTAFALLVLLTTVMAAATLLEHRYGTTMVATRVYHTAWFAALWGVMTACGLAWLWHARPLKNRKTLKRNLHLWLLHGALALILLGAALTALTAKSGQMHLRLHVPEQAYMDDNLPYHPLVRLPFSVELTAFDVHYHPGTQTADNYVSHLRVDGKACSVSMNHVLEVKGWRLFQMSFDNDLQGSRLMLRYDPWGMPVTYAGYALLLLALTATLCSPHGAFRRNWRMLNRTGVLLLACCAVLPTMAGEAGPHTLSAEATEAFGRLYVSHGGRICPVQTLARDFCRKVCDTETLPDLTAEQVLTGWLLWPEEWNAQQVMPLKSRTLRKALQSGHKASFNDFFDNGYRLAPLLQAGGRIARAAAEADDRVQIIYALQHNELLRLFPVTRGQTMWETGAEPLPAGVLPQTDSLWVKTIWGAMRRAAQRHDEEGIMQCIGQLAAFQQKYAHGTLPDESRVRAERLYNAFDLPVWLYRGNLVVALCIFLLTLPRRKMSVALWRGVTAWGVTGFLALTAYIALRATVSGRLPLGNGYETMLAAAWLSLCAGGWLAMKMKTVHTLRCMPFVASGFFLLVASLSQSGEAISTLVPVLNSPLLSLHVSLIMMAYCLLTFTFLIAVAALLRPEEAEMYRRLSYVILYPALALLCAGIFVGAVWANQSWGRYWGWDPKEVWALITLLVYALPAHADVLQRTHSPRAFHLFMLAAFTTVLMTYFGVNYLLGGLHAYVQ